MLVNDLANRITHKYDIHEARSIVRLMLSDCFGFNLTDIYTGALQNMSKEQNTLLEQYMQRLEKGEPVQYVTEKAVFCNRTFHIAPGALIPRPETEILCEIITEKHMPKEDSYILDIGTGSGCIAITLALNIPHSIVTAWDISTEALSIARDNADKMNAKIKIKQKDILEEAKKYNIKEEFDIIVSNPPYICNKEAADMESNVLDHEPHLALFVPDNDPLLFYRNIALYASHSLKSNGQLYLEINPIYANDMCNMLDSFNFRNISLHSDQFGKQRFVCAEK